MRSPCVDAHVSLGAGVGITALIYIFTFSVVEAELVSTWTCAVVASDGVHTLVLTQPVSLVTFIDV